MCCPTPAPQPPGLNDVPVTDERSLADRLRAVLATEPDVTEERASGSLMFLINGSAAVTMSALGGVVMRVPLSETAMLIDEPAIRRIEMDNFRVEGWVRVDNSVLDTDAALHEWVTRAVSLTRCLKLDDPA